MVNSTTTEEKVKVMQAYEEGKQIQWLIRCCYEWRDFNKSEIPVWDWCRNEYRIKPEPKLRPWTWEEFLRYSNCWFAYRPDSIKKGPFYKIGMLDATDEVVRLTSSSKNVYNLKELGEAFEMVVNLQTEELAPCGVYE